MSRKNQNIHNPNIREIIGKTDKDSDIALFFAKILFVMFILVTIIAFFAIIGSVKVK